MMEGRYFADTFYFIALLSPRDARHHEARRMAWTSSWLKAGSAEAEPSPKRGVGAQYDERAAETGVVPPQ